MGNHTIVSFVIQGLETILLYLCNFPSLMTTNAVRYRLAAGDDKVLVDFGLRRAQTPRASHYAWIGGFDSTSNVDAARTLGILPKGTMAHSFVSSFSSLRDLVSRDLPPADSVVVPPKMNFLDTVLGFRRIIGSERAHEGELTAFIAYAQAFPRAFLALVDTYDTLESGVPNFIAVALALREFGYSTIGIRIDSGDLAYLSREAKRKFFEAGEIVAWSPARWVVAASNDINEETLWSLRQQEHAITFFGIGTHLVTCAGQPFFGGVYKLVSIHGESKIKLSNDLAKVTIPGRKVPYRLIGKDGKAILDVLLSADETPPEVRVEVLCRHPFEEVKRLKVVPSAVVPLQELVWDGRVVSDAVFSPAEVREYVKKQMGLLRNDHVRPLNPTPYKVSVSEKLYGATHELWQREAPIPIVR